MDSDGSFADYAPPIQHAEGTNAYIYVYTRNIHSRLSISEESNAPG